MIPIRTILHPTDLSEQSKAAFQFACALARDYQARLILLTVYSPLSTAENATDRERQQEIEEGLLSKLRGLKTDPVVSVMYRVEAGRPADVILAAAKDCDLIVMATYGQSGPHHLVMGSVTDAVNRGAACPVVSVRG